MESDLRRLPASWMMPSGCIRVFARLQASFTGLCRASGLRPGVYAGSREGREHWEPGSPSFSMPGLSHLSVAKAHSEKARKRAFHSLVAYVSPALKARAYDRCAAKP